MRLLPRRQSRPRNRRIWAKRENPLRIRSFYSKDSGPQSRGALFLGFLLSGYLNCVWNSILRLGLGYLPCLIMMCVIWAEEGYVRKSGGVIFLLVHWPVSLLKWQPLSSGLFHYGFPKSVNKTIQCPPMTTVSKGNFKQKAWWHLAPRMVALAYSSSYPVGWERQNYLSSPVPY